MSRCSGAARSTRWYCCHRVTTSRSSSPDRGRELWDLLVEPGTVAQLAAVLAAAHGVDEQTVIDDISPVIERLAGLGAVEPA